MENIAPYEHGRIKLYSDSKGRSFISLSDMIYELVEKLSPETAQDVLEQILCAPVFAKAVQAILAGHSDHEWEQSSENGEGRSSVDDLRKVLIPFADDAAKKLLQNAFEANVKLTESLRGAHEHIKKLMEEWPEPYRRYIPKREWNFISSYVPMEAVVKAIELSKAS